MCRSYPEVTFKKDSDFSKQVLEKEEGGGVGDTQQQRNAVHYAKTPIRYLQPFWGHLRKFSPD